MGSDTLKADESHWVKIPQVQLWQAVLLLCDIDPRSIKKPFKKDDTYGFEIGLSKELSDLLNEPKIQPKFDVALAHLKSGGLKHVEHGKDGKYPCKSYLELSMFATWAKALDFIVPSWFDGLVIKEKTIREDERKSVDYTIKALAHCAKIDMEKTDKSAEILSKVLNDTFGVIISEQTIVKYLKRANETVSGNRGEKMKATKKKKDNTKK